MIRYPISLPDLIVRVNQVSASWLTRAATYTGNDGLWSEIKDVWIDLQFQKCAYCECKYGDKRYARIMYDVEHYRPKNAVEPWPTQKDIDERPNLAYGFPTGAGSSKGYSKLKHNIQNYAVACKECNTIFKGSAFPIGKDRRTDEDNWSVLVGEEPLLIFPVGDWGDDPARLMRFVDGVIAVPVAAAGPDYRKAQVTIDFFRLNVREELNRERSFLIFALYSALRLAEGPLREDIEIGADALLWLQSDSAPHRACLRDFEALYRADRQKAAQVARKASAFLKSVSYNGQGFRDTFPLPAN